VSDFTLREEHLIYGVIERQVERVQTLHADDDEHEEALPTHALRELRYDLERQGFTIARVR
jgi:hypothetical protein